MQSISCARHHFPPSVIQQAVRLYLRYTLSYRDVEGEVINVLVQRRRNRAAALKLMGRLLKR